MAGDSKGPTVIAVAVTFAVWTFIIMCLRLFSRVFVLQKMGLDDCLIVCACLTSWAFSAVTVVSVKYGLGSHIGDVDPNKMETYAMVVWISSMCYLATLGFVKSSVCLFYTRLGDRLLTRLSMCMLGVIVAQASSFVLVAAFQCRPIEKAWKSTLPGTCVNINVFYLANAALNILTDIMTYTLPLPVIFKLQVPVKQKVALGFILCIGLFACVSSIIRITYIPAMLSDPDATWVIAEAMYWSVIEINVGIFASSIPSFKAIASRFIPRLIGEYSRDKGYSGWSSSNDGKKFSGFSKVPEQNIGLDSMDPRHPDGDNAIGTQIGYGGTQSQERIIPHGKIYAHTEIETNVEVSRDLSCRTLSHSP
ncbi:putative integral membrane protein [Aspergillus nomiae NRRL 13137]|uniref:Putative integral membrane protein n=1 Tax=Aspergillus nomiae NRRL (strain ATCC 15546 / NRRL 13137 / CBS 260.88 / M93) TaxID=1509407 RepID=A0A0L1ITA4_ASPN3|nr:putative integral membrane protein [Aspergillus nomiae NRRL 13137]KNG82727.1 putative integral membrane protein [Aspergillus nomiae NRRL 13137]